MICRRTFMAASAASLALPRFAMAERALGSGTLMSVSDGNLVLPGSFIFEPMPQDALGPIITEFGLSRDELMPECNLALYHDGTNTVLFDAGSGPDFMPSAGSLLDGLGEVGLTSDDITHLVFTHAHPDHIWGLLDDFDDLTFPDATYMMGRAEWDYWWNPETVNTIGEARAAFAVGAKRRMEVIEDAVEFFDDGQEILPGIAAISTPGHTPGHMSFEIRNGTDAAMILGDAVANHHVAFVKPDWPSGSDQDMPLAAKTRMALLDRLVADDVSLVGFHLPGGGMGRAEATDDGYRFVPERA